MGMLAFVDSLNWSLEELEILEILSLPQRFLLD